jgi:hypothetical protein
MSIKTSSRPFIEGLKLSELLYEQAVKPLLAAHLPGLTYAAALLGAGSEVQGFDTPQSMDHDWGPRLMLFLSEADHPTYRDQIDDLLRRELLREFHGYPIEIWLAGMPGKRRQVARRSTTACRSSPSVA